MLTACCLAALVAVTPSGAQEPVVTGRVVSGVDRAPVAQVRVSAGERSTVTGPDGRFSIPVDGPTELEFSRLGFVTRNVRGIPGTELTVVLQAAAVRVDPLRAEARSVARERFESGVQASTISLTPAEITSVPAVLEPDVVRATQLLPGVVAKNDFSTGLNVRGGESDQNLILLDGGVVFNPFHLGGVFSTFETMAVERVDFVTGGFSAAYPGRLSSVLDVGLRPGRPDLHVSGALSALAAKVMVDGPAGPVRYLVSVRRTYADQLVQRFSSEDLPYYFGDAVARFDVPAFGGLVRLTGYWGRDDLDWPWVEESADTDPIDLRFAWGNRMGTLAFDRPVGGGTLSVHASGSGFDARFGLEPDLLRVQNDVSLWTGQLSYQRTAGDHEVTVGGGAAWYRMRYDIRSNSLATAFFSARYSPAVWSAFVDDEWKPTPWLYLRPGVRFEYIPQASFARPAPRLAAKVFVDDETAFTASAGRYYQAVHSLRDPDVPYTLFDFWIGTDDRTPVASSDHLVAGIERWVADAVSVTVEGYRKTFDNLVIRSRRQDPRIRGDEFVLTTGDAWGVDALVRKHRGSVRGWISYGYAQAERRAAGAVFPPAHDRRHTFNAVAFLPGPIGSEMSIRWGFGSPLPYTGLDGAWRHRRYNAATHAFDDFDEEPVASTIRNGERYPAYNRLDVSFRWETRAWGGVLRPYLQVINAYNRTNVFVYLYDYSDAPATRTGLSQFPLFPSVGLEFEF